MILCGKPEWHLRPIIVRRKLTWNDTSVVCSVLLLSMHRTSQLLTEGFVPFFPQPSCLGLKCRSSAKYQLLIVGLQIVHRDRQDALPYFCVFPDGYDPERLDDKRLINPITKSDKWTANKTGIWQKSVLLCLKCFIGVLWLHCLETEVLNFLFEWNCYGTHASIRKEQWRKVVSRLDPIHLLNVQ